MNKRYAFVKARDASRRAVPNLYTRHGSFYARIVLNGRRECIRLDGVKKIEDAKEAMQRLKMEGIGHDVATGRTFESFASEYLRIIENLKRPKTVRNEREQVNQILNPFFGGMFLAQIKLVDIDRFISERKGEKVSNTTVNHNLIVLRNVLKKAAQYEYIKSNPALLVKQLKRDTKRKVFTSFEDIKAVCDFLVSHMRRGKLTANAILFMAFAGGRKTESFHVVWGDVEWEFSRVWFNRTKSGRPRSVDFNPDLSSLIHKMWVEQEKPTSGLLFPSWRTPEEVEPLKDIRNAISSAIEQVNILRKKQGQPSVKHFSHHDLRHHFASRCVMAGIDFKTIAEWLGHQDGGMLVANIYGHLSPGHGRVQAAKLVSLQDPPPNAIPFSQAATDGKSSPANQEDSRTHAKGR